MDGLMELPPYINIRHNVHSWMRTCDKNTNQIWFHWNWTSVECCIIAWHSVHLLHFHTYVLVDVLFAIDLWKVLKNVFVLPLKFTIMWIWC